VSIPLPRHCPEHVNSSLLQVIALAHFAIVHVRSWCVNSPIARVRLAAKCDRRFLWYDTCRPHQSLGGATPAEVWGSIVPANEGGGWNLGLDTRIPLLARLRAYLLLVDARR
jgi:hypothetical protein